MTAANRIELSDPGAVWEVAGGTLDVFLAPTPAARGRLRPLASLGPGTLVLGLAPAPGGHVQVGRRALGAELRRVTEDEAGGLLDGPARLMPWLTGVLAAGGHEAPPRTFAAIEPGVAIALPAGQVARPVAEAMVLEVGSGQVRLSGEADTRLGPGEVALVGMGDWVTATADAVVKGRDLERELASSGWGGVARLAGAALATAEDRALAAEQGESDRVRRRGALDERSARTADDVLASLLGGGSAGKAVHDPSADALLACARAVGDAIGVTIATPPRPVEGSRIEPVAAIAQASHVRTRAVRLEGSWWQDDPEPMLATLAKDGRPVALLPRRRGLHLWDPADGSLERVTAERAAGLGTHAHVFYRSFPEGPLTARAVARFAARGTRRPLAKLLLAGLAVAGIGLLVPILTGTILGTLVPRGESGLIADLCLLLLAAALATLLLSVSQNLVLLRLQGRLDALLQAAVWDRLMSLPVAFFRTRTVGALATAILSVSATRDVLASAGAQTMLVAIVAAANLGLIFFYSVAIGLLAVAVLVVTVAIAAYANSAQARHQRAAFAASQHLNARTFELVRGVTKLRTAAAEDRAFAHWAPAFAAGRTTTFRARVAQNRITVFNSALSLLGTMALFLFASRVVDIETPAFLVVFTAFAQVLGSAATVSNTIASIVAVVPYLEGLGPIVQATPEVGTTKTDPGELVGEIEVSHLTFRYDPERPPALEDVSLKARPGQFVAIVGPSGCGKSTLLRMLLGFDQPESGSVLYDGTDLAGLDAGAIRRNCGVVLQDGQLFPGDLSSNIAGSGAFTRDEVLEAARMAGLAEDIAAMPLGLSTIVSEGAATLSGGQRQRVMIARALIGRPRILFFDEATSALDNRTQAVVTESTRVLNATRIVIAHRLSTVIDADVIVVMEAGRVVQTGRYEELAAQDGLFRRLAERQVA